MTHAERLHFALALALLGLVALVATCSACGATQHPQRTEADRANSAVTIAVQCPDGTQRGSGTVVSHDRVLTAFHVVVCDGGILGPITVSGGDGTWYKADIDVVVLHLDTVRLRIDGDMTKWMSDVEIGPVPYVGEEVCESTGYPRWTYRCGRVQPQWDGEGWTRQFRFGFMAEHGNSGAGIYDQHGRLIGLVSQWRACEGGVNCEGTAHPLEGYEWLVPGPGE